MSCSICMKSGWPRNARVCRAKHTDGNQTSPGSHLHTGASPGQRRQGRCSRHSIRRSSKRQSKPCLRVGGQARKHLWLRKEAAGKAKAGPCRGSRCLGIFKALLHLCISRVQLQACGLMAGRQLLMSTTAEVGGMHAGYFTAWQQRHAAVSTPHHAPASQAQLEPAGSQVPGAPRVYAFTASSHCCSPWYAAPRREYPCTGRCRAASAVKPIHQKQRKQRCSGHGAAAAPRQAAATLARPPCPCRPAPALAQSGFRSTVFLASSRAWLYWPMEA